MNEDEALVQLSLVDGLEFLAFDGRLTSAPEPLVQAVWEAIGLVRP